MIRTSLLCFLLALLSWACNSETAVDDSPKKTNRYYDLNSYFQNEIERLNQSNTKVNKTISLNEEQEQKTGLEPDYSTELLIFSESHINKVSWWGKYAGDTTYYDNGRIRKIVYTARQDDLKTKSISISFSEGNEIDSLFILNSTDNPTISTHQELTYIPNVKYKIFSQEKVALSKDRKVVVEGVFSE